MHALTEHRINRESIAQGPVDNIGDEPGIALIEVRTSQGLLQRQVRVRVIGTHLVQHVVGDAARCV